MQKPIKRGNSYRMAVYYKGKTYYKTFQSYDDCITWATAKLNQLKQAMTFYELFIIYIDQIGQYKPSYSYMVYQIHAIHPILKDTPIKHITPQLITKWRNERLKQVKPSTVNRQISLYSAIFTFAVKELFILDDNPFLQVKKPTNPKPRSQRITAHHEQLILNGLGFDGHVANSKHYVAVAFLLALQTAMRRGEILSLTWDNVHERHVHLPMTKNGYSRDVPLNTKARELIKILPKHQDKLFLLSSNAHRLTWQRNLHHVRLSGVITFHDTRHEAICRMVAKGIPVEKLAKITGHRDIKTLINVYYNPTIDDLAHLLD